MSWLLYRSTNLDKVRAAIGRETSSFSSGEVTRTHLFSNVPNPDILPLGSVQFPEAGGARCQKVFGPVRDFVCRCGKYQGLEHKAKRCPKCGVEVLSANVRSTRWGHALLSAPVFHPIFAKAVANETGLTPEDVLRVARQEVGLALGDDGQTSDQIEEFPADQGPLENNDERWQRRGIRGLTSISEIAKSALVTELPIPPPNERPLVKRNEEWLPSDFDMALQRLLSVSKTCGQLVECNAPFIIQHTFEQRLQRLWEDLLGTSKGLSQVCVDSLSVKAELVLPSEEEDFLENFSTRFLPTEMGMTFLFQGNITHHTYEAALQNSPCLASLPFDATLITPSECDRFAAFAFTETTFGVLDLQKGAWLKTLPAGFSVQDIEWKMTRLERAETLYGEADRNDDVLNETSSCGRYLWLAPYIYDITSPQSFGRVVAMPSRAWFDEKDTTPFVSPSEILSFVGDEFEDHYEGFGDRRHQNDVRAIAFSEEQGFIILEHNTLSTRQGPIAYLDISIETAAFSHDGSLLGLFDGQRIHFINTETFVVDSRDVTIIAQRGTFLHGL